MSFILRLLLIIEVLEALLSPLLCLLLVLDLVALATPLVVYLLVVLASPLVLVLLVASLHRPLIFLLVRFLASSFKNPSNRPCPLASFTTYRDTAGCPSP